MDGYRLGEGFVEHADRVAAPQEMVRKYLSENLPYRAFSMAVDNEDLCR
jgi:hypothetical protein